MKYTRNSTAIKLIGDKIKLIRLSQNISQSQLAFEAEIPRNQIGRIERGEINTSISSLFSIAKALNSKITELIDIDLDINSY